VQAEREEVAALASALCDIWRNVLERDDLDEDADLFAAGGSSIQVLEIVGQVFDALSIDVRLRQIFENPSPRSLAIEILRSDVPA
jgi:acyl carrier protein